MLSSDIFCCLSVDPSSSTLWPLVLYGVKPPSVWIPTLHFPTLWCPASVKSAGLTLLHYDCGHGRPLR